MSQLYDLLTTVRNKLHNLDGVNTCAIGLEANITPDSYPIIRIVPSKIVSGDNGQRRVDVIVYFGEPIHEFEVGGLEEIYRRHFEQEAAIIEALHGTGWRVKYLETFYDEDRLPAYKLMALRFEATIMAECQALRI